MDKNPMGRLAARIREEGGESGYLGRYAGWGEISHQLLEEEIAGEMSSALGRAGEKVERALERLTAAGEAVDRSSTAERPAKVEAFNALREQAVRARWELQVHREALGLLRHRELDEVYPVPPKRR